MNVEHPSGALTTKSKLPLPHRTSGILWLKLSSSSLATSPVDLVYNATMFLDLMLESNACPRFQRMCYCMTVHEFGADAVLL